MTTTITPAPGTPTDAINIYSAGGSEALIHVHMRDGSIHTIKVVDTDEEQLVDVEDVSTEDPDAPGDTAELRTQLAIIDQDIWHTKREIKILKKANKLLGKNMMNFPGSQNYEEWQVLRGSNMDQITMSADRLTSLQKRKAEILQNKDLAREMQLESVERQLKNNVNRYNRLRGSEAFKLTLTRS